jgi:hypothetical protein
MPDAVWHSSCCGVVQHASCLAGYIVPCPSQLPLRLLVCAIFFAAAATWNNAPVAVKIITHSSADDSRISQEMFAIDIH